MMNAKKTISLMAFIIMLSSCQGNNLPNDNLEFMSIIQANKDIIENLVVENTNDEQVDITENSENLSYFEESLMDAEQGNVDAINYVAFAYYHGNEVYKDFKKSFEWSLKGANLGNAASQYNVGWCYEKGEGIEQNYKEAIYWYTLSANNNFPKSICALGYIHYLGKGTDVDYDKAYHFFMKAAGSLDSNAMLNLATMYEDGKGVDKNLDKAYTWYEITAHNHSDKKDAYKKLEEIYESNNEYALKQIKTPPFGSNSIPDELILEAQKYVFSSNPTGFTYKYAANNNVDFETIEKSGAFKEYVDDFNKYLRWYDSIYQADINSDGKDEFLFYRLEGTIGISSIFIVSENDEGVYDRTNDLAGSNSSYSSVWHGKNELIKFEDNYYFVIVYPDFLDRTLSKMEIFAFEDNKLNNSVLISNNRENMGFIKTFQNSQDMDPLVESIESEIGNIMSEIDHINYLGAEHELNEIEINELKTKFSNFPEALNYSTDLNNDGIDEYFYSSMWETSSVNSINNLSIALYMTEENRMIESSLDNIIPYEFNIGILKQFFIKEYQGENYMVFVHQNYCSKNYSITIHKANNESSELIASFLVYYTGDIEIEVKHEFIEASPKG